MKLDANIPHNPKRGKYALVLMRQVSEKGALLAEYSRPGVTNPGSQVNHALSVLGEHGCLDYGADYDKQFFVIRLKDKHAYKALQAYADSVIAEGEDIEYANEILSLAKAALNHSGKKKPD